MSEHDEPITCLRLQQPLAPERLFRCRLHFHVLELGDGEA